MKKFNLNIKIISILLIFCVFAGGCKTIQKTEKLTVNPTETTEELIVQTTEEETSVDEIVKNLQGLDIDTFFEKSFNQLMLRETKSDRAIEPPVPIENSENKTADDYLRDTRKLEIAILDLLKEYDRAILTPEQQISFNVYKWYLDNEIYGHKLIHIDYQIIPDIINILSVFNYINLDSDFIFMISENPKDYIEKLANFDDRYYMHLNSLKSHEKNNIIIPKFIIQWLLHYLRCVTNDDALLTPFYIEFKKKLYYSTKLDDVDKQNLLKEAEIEINKSVIPAIQSVIDYFEYLETITNNYEGVFKSLKGEDYYKYLLCYHTTTNMTAEEIHKLGLQEVDRIQAEIQNIFNELGYPKDETLSKLFNLVANNSGYLTGEDIVKGFEEIIKKAEENINIAFDKKPNNIISVEGSIRDFYSIPAINGEDAGVFKVDIKDAESKYIMPTIAYHETIPGHYLQLTIEQKLNLPPFRKMINFTAYSEGWATYAERLAWELGFYENDVYGNLGRLQDELLRAVRLVVDTGIHSKGWTFDQSVKYMTKNTGYPLEKVQYEITRYISWPGQATAYKIGMMKILELRQKATDKLGDKFDIKEFHNVILSNGSMPLELLEKVVNDYIESKLKK